MVLFGELRGVDLISWLPCVVAIRVSNQFDQVLELLIMSVISVIDDTFYFIFFFPIDKVRWWSGEVRAVCSCFVIWG